MERELVKQLGAMWDPARKKWFVWPGFELEPFKRWLQPDKSAGRARTALIATGSVSGYRKHDDTTQKTRNFRL